MAAYELVHEILNECPNNQMRDVFIREVETADPVAYVRGTVRGENVEIASETHADGTVVVHVNCSGLLQRFTFTPFD